MWICCSVGCVDDATTVTASALESRLQLFDAAGTPRSEVEVGESLFVAADGLVPLASYRLAVRADQGNEVFSLQFAADADGTIAPRLLWPDVGLGTGGDRFFGAATLAAAHAALAGTHLTVELDGAHADLGIATKRTRTRLFAASANGAPRQTLEAGKDDLAIVAHNFPTGAFEVAVVAARSDWKLGDPILPVVSRRIDVKADDVIEQVWPRQKIAAGSYQLFARRADQPGDWTLADADIVSDRWIDTVTVFDPAITERARPYPFFAVATTDIAGTALAGAPHFAYTDTFASGAPVWLQLDPELGGGYRKVRLHVIRHRSGSEWRASTALDGSVAMIETLTRADSGRARQLLVATPLPPGRYDVVADLGNRAEVPINFIADNRFDAAYDPIDGYLRPGFTVVEDPGRTGTFAVGRTSLADGNVTIPVTPPIEHALIAEVRYPADAAGDGVPVSTRRARYPLVVVAQLHFPWDGAYRGYDYLLEHLASHGYIAVALRLDDAIHSTGSEGQAHGVLAHLTALAAHDRDAGLFQHRIDLAQIALLGHSTGGGAVVIAEARNRAEGLGWNIGAVITLSPTDGSGTTASPPTLRTARHLAIYGSNDGDIGTWIGYPYGIGGIGTAFRIYDRSESEKAMVFVLDADHDSFVRLLDSEWHTDPSAVVLSKPQHEAVLCAYTTAFLQWQLEGRTELRTYFTGESRIPSLPGIQTRHQYSAAADRKLVVDRFDNYVTSRNSIGGFVGWGGFDSLREGPLPDLDLRTPHASMGAKLRWSTTAGVYRSYLPGAYQDLSGYEYLSVRAGQTAGMWDSVANHHTYPPPPSGPDPIFQQELDRSVVSDSFRYDFERALHLTLSPFARVTVVTPGSLWRLVDGGDGRTFDLRLDGDLIYIWRNGPESNPAGYDLDFFVRLTSSDGNSRRARVGYFGRIPPPARPRGGDHTDRRTLAALQTIRIPLSAFTIDVPGEPTVDLTSVTEIRFEMSASPTGELLFDDLEVTH
ncbi:MAG: hypothetical protein ABI867_18650 [Kofleriaceae bacterium]